MKDATLLITGSCQAGLLAWKLFYAIAVLSRLIGPSTVSTRRLPQEASTSIPCLAPVRGSAAPVRPIPYRNVHRAMQHCVLRIQDLQS